MKHFLLTNRHGLAAVQGSDGCLGRLSAAELHEGTALAGSVRAPDMKIKFIRKILSKLISSLY